MRGKIGAVAFGLLTAFGVLNPSGSVRPAQAQGQYSNQPSQLRIIKVPVPKLVGEAKDWQNTNGKVIPFKKGQVYVVHFWTFGCINCHRNLPSYSKWLKKYAKQNVTFIGVHTPETDEERSAENVARALKRWNITYPNLIDKNLENWKRWEQQYWPTVYLIDKQGFVRYYWVGELEWNRAGGEAIMERYLGELLREPYSEPKNADPKKSEQKDEECVSGSECALPRREPPGSDPIHWYCARRPGTESPRPCRSCIRRTLAFPVGDFPSPTFSPEIQKVRSSLPRLAA
jgi:thiol-disulfide isomerase/thioredoxin